MRAVWRKAVLEVVGGLQGIVVVVLFVLELRWRKVRLLHLRLLVLIVENSHDALGDSFDGARPVAGSAMSWNLRLLIRVLV